MKVAYIAGPYRAPNEWSKHLNIEMHRQAAAMLLCAGWGYFSPILQSAWMDGLVPPNRFIEADLEIMRRLKPDMLLLLIGWENSEGSRLELAEAQKLGIPAITMWEFERSQHLDSIVQQICLADTIRHEDEMKDLEPESGG